MFSESEVVVGHVGDSRAYLARDGAIQQLTTDHTLVQDLVDAGQIRADEALSHPKAHILTRAIGSEPALQVDIQRFWVWQVAEGEPVDQLILCTDGLYSLVSEGEMADVLAQNTPQRACVKFVEIARARGGFDNISVAVIPLAGQLRQEAPEGYARASQARRRASTREREAEPPVGIVRTIIVVAVLSGLAALLTVIAMAFSLGA